MSASPTNESFSSKKLAFVDVQSLTVDNEGFSRLVDKF